jgi:cell division protein FtsI/penicillin-binding protein 2
VAVIDRRVGILFVAFASLLVLALARAVYLGSFQAGTLQRVAAEQQVTAVTTPAPRGTITDRNGMDLAVSQAADDVVADPFLIQDPQLVANALAPLLNQPFSTVLAKVTTPHRGFVYLAHLLPADQATAIERRASALHVAGISLIPETKRVYPRGWAASQVLGNVGWGDRGLSGLEYLYNGQLRGTDGVRKIVSDAKGQPISIDEVRQTAPGKTIRLTIDAALQDEVEQVLAGVGAQYSPQRATAIVADPRTGDLLAVANWPRVDANNPFSAPLKYWENLAVGFSYEPGSTFKAITVAGALQDGLITPSTLFDIPPVLHVYDRQIHDAELHGYETLSVAQILQKSSNIGADLIGERLGGQRFDYWVHHFGFGSATGTDLPGEQQGVVLHSWQYSGTSMATLPFGQGEEVTPIQMIQAYDAIANGGVLRPPHVVQSIGGKPAPAGRGQRILSPTVAAELRDMLRGVLADGGTASGAAIPGYEMAGKTGTASIVVNGKYSDTQYVASFIGMVPTRNPRLVVAVVVDRPQGSIYGGSVAAPAFQKIVGWAVPYFGISPR